MRSGAAEYANPTATGASARRSHVQWHLLTVALLAADAASLGVSFALAYISRFKAGIPFLTTPDHSLVFYSSLAFLAIPVWLLIFALYHLYDRNCLFVGLHEYIRIFNACSAGVLAVVVVSFLDSTIFISRGWLLIVWALSVLIVGSHRFALRHLLRLLRARGFFVVPTVIVGANEEGRALAEQFLADPGSGLRIIGFIDNVLPLGTQVIDRTSVLGDFRDLERVVRNEAPDQIIVASTAIAREDLLELFRRFGHAEGVAISLSSGLAEILTTGVTVQEVSYVPLMTPQRVRITGGDAFLKSTFDYCAALVGLLILSPLLLGIVLLVKFDSPGPVLHRRQVLGRGGRLFHAYKFRTMVANADEVLAADPQLREAIVQEYKLKSDPRVTRIGRLLRRSSLDELPQLFNVLRGEMSLVGPRMIAPEESHRYGKWQLNLLTVKPGITGPWQVRGRSDVPYDERVRLSMQYIRNYSVWLDLEILLRTVYVVLRGAGAY
ncbi:MAG: sugar transferase [Chloroflexota bacterium]